MRVGGNKEIEVDVRVIAATHPKPRGDGPGRAVPPGPAVPAQHDDSLQIPPLRERTTEIAPLARLFAARAAASVGLTVQPELTAEALTRLEAYSWPGNIRELRNAIERAVLLGGEVIAPEHLPLDKLSAVWTAAPARSTSSMRDRIMEALEATAHNQTRAAERLGVSRQTLSTWLDRYDIPRPRRRGP
jgi:DNA-binding NtrC family response regulator